MNECMVIRTGRIQRPVRMSVYTSCERVLVRNDQFCFQWYPQNGSDHPRQLKQVRTELE